MAGWHYLSAEQAFKQLQSNPDGLAEDEAVDRLKHWGRNQLRPRKPISPFKLFLKQFLNFFILILLFAAILAYAISYMPGQEERKLTAYFILVIILLSVSAKFLRRISLTKRTRGTGKVVGISHHRVTGGGQARDRSSVSGTRGCDGAFTRE